MRPRRPVHPSTSSGRTGINPAAPSARRQRAPPFAPIPAPPFAPIPAPPFALSLSKGECWQLHPGDAGPVHASTGSARTGAQPRRPIRPATACTTGRANTGTSVRPEPVEGRVLAVAPGRREARSSVEPAVLLRGHSSCAASRAFAAPLVEARSATRGHSRQFTTDGREPERVNFHPPSRRRH